MSPLCNISNETLRDNFFLLKNVYRWIVPSIWTSLTLSAGCNCVILFSSRFLRRKTTPNLRLSLSLAAADTWTAFLMMVSLLVNSYLPVVIGFHVFQRLKCAALSLELVRVSAMVSSALHLFVLAANHCYSIFRPLEYKVTVTRRRCNFVVAFLWIFPALVFGCVNMIPNQGLFGGCRSKFYYQFPFRLGVFLFFCIPLFASVCIYFIVLRRLWSSRLTNVESPDGARSSASNRLKRKMKAVTTTCLIVGTYGFSWFPCVLFFVLVCKEGCVFNGCNRDGSTISP